MVSEARIDQSIRRLLKEKFDLGLFENPYVDIEHAKKIVGNEEFQAQGDLAMRKSIVLLKNDQNLLPIKAKTKVYFESYFEKNKEISPTVIFQKADSSYDFQMVDSKQEADLVVLWLNPHFNSLFSSDGSEIDVRLSKNKINVDYVNEVTSQKPTVVVVNFTNPWVISEIQNAGLHTLLATFGNTPEGILDVLAGKINPSGKLPFTIPASIEHVKSNLSDVPGYLEKTEGYALFKFGFGLQY